MIYLVSILIYLLALTGIGIYKSRQVKTQADFAVAGRTLSPWILVCTMLAAWIGTGSIVGNAGILVTRVLYTKEGGEKNFIIVDAAMNDLIRPSLYGSYQRIQPVRRSERPEIIADVVGPICESGDFLAKDRQLLKVEGGELLAVMSAGAYGFSMSSNYNSRPRVPEVLVDKDRWFIIRQREEYDDLIKGEFIPDFLA